MRLVSARQGPSRQFLPSASPTHSPLTFLTFVNILSALAKPASLR
jgi:hypothetical protein